METENFVTSLQSFLEGSISLNGLLEEIERIAGENADSAAALIEVLEEEHRKCPLTPESYNRIKQKIQGINKGADTQEIEAADLFGSDQPPANEKKGDQSTKLATAYVPPASPALPGPATAEATALAEVLGISQQAGADQIKGTGDVLNGRFELKECLGTGGMSTVYKALDRRKLEASDRDPYVAVKVLNQDFRAHPDSLIALQREAKKCQNLAHRNIVRVYDFDRDGDTVYMTMEHLTGDSLARRIASPDFKGMSVEETLRIVQSMGEALAFAHESGIVHSDFKPANVFLTDREEIKVIDFGIARAFHRAEDSSSMELTRFDPGSLGALTPSYASPEMLEQREPDPRDDIFALACTTYEMLTGEHPFNRLQANLARDSGLEAKKPEKLNRKQWRALQDALDFNREKRTSSVNLFLEQIAQPSAKSNRSGLISGIFVVVLILSAGGWYYLSNLDDGALDKIEAASQNLQIQIPGLKGPTPDQGPKIETDENAGSIAQSITIIPSDAPRQSNASAVSKQETQEKPEITLESITPFLARLPCAAIHASVNNASVALSGYALQSDITRLENDLRALEGVRGLNIEIQAGNKINCQTIELIAPHWLTNRQQNLGTSIRTQEPSAKFKAGDYLVLDIKSPAYDSYITIDYYSHDGGVFHMLPSPRFPYNQAPENYSATLGDLGEWRVGAPFGKEMIVLLATPEPLFENQRNEFETQAEYLPDLRKRLEDLANRVNSDRITADIVLITTSP